MLRQSPVLKLITRLLAMAFVLYAGACLALFAFQRSLIYFPQPRSVTTESNTMRLPVDGAELVVTVRPHAGPKALIYFGGNAEDVSMNLQSFSAAFPDHALYLMHYRGYGGSSGQPTEAALNADARVLVDTVKREHGDIALVGRSLGSGVAIHLAAERPANRLILVTPYASILELAQQSFTYFPIQWLLSDTYESWRYAPSVHIPTLLLAADQDELIPAASTDRLFKAFPPGGAALTVIHDVGHNTISESAEYLKAMQAAL